MGSTRLPGKVLRPLASEPMLARVVDRAALAETLDAVWVATSDAPADDALAALAAARGWPVTRGSEHDVLARYADAAEDARADRVVRLTADCPLIDPAVIDAVVRALGEGDYASNVVPDRTFPHGLDVEAFTADALAAAAAEAGDPAEREHVTPFLWRRPDRFAQSTVRADGDYSGHRWTVDQPEDLALVERVYDAMGNRPFGWRQVLDLFDDHPEWREINAHVRQKAV